MPNSFDLTTLDGVTFGPGTLSGGGGQVGAGEAPTVDETSSDPATGYVAIAYVNGADTDAGTISNAVNAYTAAFDDGTNQHLATFGSFTLSNADNGTGSQTLWVHGFADGAMLLSTEQDLTFADVAGGQFEILANADLRAGPTSLAFPTEPLAPESKPHPPKYMGPDMADPNYPNLYGRGSYIDSTGGRHSIIEYDRNGDGTIADYDKAGPNGPVHVYETYAAFEQGQTATGLPGNYYSGNPAPPTFPLGFTADSSVYLAPVCFAEGTRIETVRGAVAVEALVEGDRVVTAGGAPRDVVWLGQMIARPARHPRPWEVAPVRVRAHAFGPAMPERDIRLSPGHAVYVDGVLVPVGHLVNGATIVQEDVEQIRYFHVELDTHDVLLAEGLPCESYLDDGNRATFVNAAGHADLHGRLDPLTWDDACAPMVAAGPQLTSLQQRLHDQAEALGWTKSEDAGLRLVAGDTEIAPVHAAGNRLWFAVPAAASLTLRSAAGVLAHVMPGIADYRTLGIAVAELRIDGVPLALDDAAFGSGFHRLERHDHRAWRWTDGEATLARALPAPAMVEVTVVMVAPTWQRTAPALRVVA